MRVRVRWLLFVAAVFVVVAARIVFYSPAASSEDVLTTTTSMSSISPLFRLVRRAIGGKYTRHGAATTLLTFSDAISDERISWQKALKLLAAGGGDVGGDAFKALCTGALKAEAASTPAFYCECARVNFTLYSLVIRFVLSRYSVCM
jgi:hypothetical protein